MAKHKEGSHSTIVIAVAPLAIFSLQNITLFIFILSFRSQSSFSDYNSKICAKPYLTYFYESIAYSHMWRSEDARDYQITTDVYEYKKERE